MWASFGCGGTTPKPSTPAYFRSPPLDYVDAPRSAGDGEALGALQHPPDDWLLAGATTDHSAPGWSKHDGRLRFEPEHAHASHGTPLRVPPCPPASPPLAPEDAEQQAALWRAWVKAVREPPLPVFASAVSEVPPERSGFLSCNSR
jgi:hypothetical protein